MLSKVKSLGREKRMMKLMEEETRCTTIGLLDDGDPIICDFNKDSKGQFLMDRVCNMLNILERDYFGLRFIDGEKQMHWLDPCKLISRQLKGGPPFNLVFRVKFYPADIGNLKEELTRYLLFLQLKRDLLHGRLLCSKEDMAMLGAYIVQAAIGNHDPLVHLHGYASEFYFGPGQSERVENRVEQLHHTMTKGQSPSEAEENFLRKARTLETYGVDPHSVKDIYGSQLHLGFTHEGLSVFQGSKRIQLFRWHDIGKFGYEGKTFFIHAMVNQRKLTHAYKSATTSASKHIWKCGLEHQAFFKFRRSSEITMQTSGGMLFKTTKFKFSGRTEKEAMTENKKISREAPEVKRSPPKLQPRRASSFRDKIYQDFFLSNPAQHSTPAHTDDDTNIPVYNETFDLADNEPVTDGKEVDFLDQTEFDNSSLPSPPPRNKENEKHEVKDECLQTKKPEQVKQKPVRPSSKCMTCIKMLLLFFNVLILVSLALVIIVMETQIQHEYLDEIRRIPEVREIKELYYIPFRRWAFKQWKVLNVHYVPFLLENYYQPSKEWVVKQAHWAEEQSYWLIDQSHWVVDKYHWAVEKAQMGFEYIKAEENNPFKKKC